MGSPLAGKARAYYIVGVACREPGGVGLGRVPRGHGETAGVPYHPPYKTGRRTRLKPPNRGATVGWARVHRAHAERGSSCPRGSSLVLGPVYPQLGDLARDGVAPDPEPHRCVILASVRVAQRRLD